MTDPHLQPDDLAGKVIDSHSHVGVTLKGYACMEYPYAQTLEGLYYRQRACGVDVNIVFPFSPDLHFDLRELTQGRMVRAVEPLSPAPYAVENELLLTEIFVYCPEIRRRFIPFVSVDPGRDVAAQLENLRRLEKLYPIYGIKIVPVLCQSRITELLGAGRAFIDYAQERDLPFLLHVTSDPRETYSYVADTFRVVDAYPATRFCLAHSLLFHQDYLQRADDASNVWVDTAALKIQIQLVRQIDPPWTPPDRMLKGDYTDHKAIMRALLEKYPDTILWGSDSPAYAYICRRKQAEGVYQDFRLKATYEDEKAALDALPADLRRKAGNTNTLRFLFGPRAPEAAHCGC